MKMRRETKYEEKPRKYHLKQKSLHLPSASDQSQKEHRKSQLSFENLGLSSQISFVCTQVGWHRPSMVQEYCIPRILSPFEYLPKRCNQTLVPCTFSIQAPPGSGKTASYVLPILHHLMNSCTNDTTSSRTHLKRAPKSFLHFFSSLIIAPTNELCLQIYNQLLLFGEPSRVKIGMIVGGGRNKKSSRSHFLDQISMVHDRTVHIFVGTPGRIEYILLDSSAVSSENLRNIDDNKMLPEEENSIKSILKNLHFLVLDEADMLITEKAMERSISRIINLMLESKRESILEHNESLSEMVEVKKAADLSIILVSATLKKSTVNAVWSRCAKVMNRKISVYDDKSMKEIQYDDPSSYESLKYIPPAPMAYVLKDSMSVGQLTSYTFNSLVEQQCLLCPAHVKLVHLYLLLSPSSASCVFHRSGENTESVKPHIFMKKKAIVFFNSKHECEITRITLQQLGLSVCALHSLQSPEQRSECLFSFQMHVYSILLTTDICCRGLDVASVDFILHYDIPKTLERYIHRIGRAVRESHHRNNNLAPAPSSNLGQSILFVTERDKRAFRKFEKSVSEIMRDDDREHLKNMKWKINRRKEIQEENILKYLDVVLQARLQAENIVSTDQDSENLVFTAP